MAEPIPARPLDRAASARRRPDVLLIARVAFVIVGVYPWLLTLARGYLPLGPIGELLDTVFVLICHRMPERTLVLAGTPMPVCSRCAGIFAGLALGSVIAWPSPSLKQARIALACAAAAVLTDIVTQDLGLHPPWHPTRLATGALLGYLAVVALVAAIRRERA